MRTLYITGNGFDIYHSLRTRYADFHQFVSDQNSDLENKIEEYFDFQIDANYLWKCFENDLCNFNHRAFFDNFNHLDIMDEGFKPSQCFGLEDDIVQESEELVQGIKDAFLNWIESIEYPDKAHIATRLLGFEPNSLFLNFNYTDTLEILYDIPKSQVIYLHNNTTDLSGELIFGHAEKQEKKPREDDLDEFGNSTRTMFTDAEDAARAPFYEFQKNTDAVMASHQQFFDRLSDIEEVVVLGHSLGRVDWPYFQRIASSIPCAKWKISYYPVAAKKELEYDATEMLRALSPKIAMIEIQDLLS